MPPPSLFSTTVAMSIVTVMALAGTFTGLFFALLVQSPQANTNVFFVPTNPPTSSSATASSAATTTSALPTTTTTTSVAPTTMPVTLYPVNITCPPNVTLTLGGPLDPPSTGGYPVAGGGCTMPVTQYTDTPPAMLGPARRNIDEDKDTATRWTNHHMDNTEMIPSGDDDAGIHVSPVMINTSDMMADNGDINHFDAQENHIVLPRKRGQSILGKRSRGRRNGATYQRSVSFNTTNLQVQGTPLTVSNTGVAPPDSTAAVSDQYVVMGVNHASGTLVVIADRVTTMLQSSFILSSLGTGMCAGATRGDPQVLWDHDAQRWVLLELGVSGSNYICVYLSDTANPAGTYSTFQYDFGSYFPDFPKLGLWPYAYGLTFNLNPAFVGDVPRDLCVIDRQDMLNFVPAPNKTAPSLLCASSFYGRLGGFGFQAWTPISAEGGPMPPNSTQAAGGVGAGMVFMRHYDNELHSTGGTPTVDYLEVEHWSNINWTTQTFSAIRYRINIADFDSSFSGCTASDECIPTPTAQQVDPVREVINQRLQYRYIPATGQESVVGTFTSHANGVDVARTRWFELRWSTPVVGQPKSWRLHQEGTLPWQDGEHRWMAAINMDGNGTIVMAYSQSSATTFPSLYATSRLQNDPVGGMRTPLLLRQGPVGSTIPGNRWGDYASVSIDPVGGKRTFYVTGQTADNVDPWQVRLTRLRVLGETIVRTWRADDTCGGFATCVQTLEMI